MRLTTRQTLKHCLIAVATAVAGLLMMGGTASAAITAAPKITVKPSNPNTTDATSTFTYTKGDGEASTVATIRYYCRVYDADAAPPSPTALWAACGSTTDSKLEETKTYDQSNGNWTFDVAARESSGIATQGPVASYTWTQSVPLFTKAPEITVKPSANNTSQATVKFEFKKATDETSPAVAFFYCRQYLVGATPPAWAACGSSANPVGRTIPNLVNGDYTFDVAARINTNAGTQGDLASYSWTQNLSAPTKAALVTSQPDNPMTVSASDFTYTAGDGEADLADRFQCRIDSTEESGWASCATTGRTYAPGNGDHTFQVRAGNVVGYGPPSDPVTWTVDVSNPQPSVAIDEAATSSWSGATPNKRVAYIQNVGDLNNDGLQDLGIKTPEAKDLLDVVYSNPTPSSPRTLGSQQPGEGFRIMAATGQNIIYATGISDQNDDGIDDLLVVSSDGSGGFGNPKVAIVYGGINVAGLPACPTVAAHCLNFADIASGFGYILTSAVKLGGNSNTDQFATGDFDGDGVDDLLLPTGGNGGQAFVVKGKERSGTVSMEGLPADEMLTITTGPKCCGGGAVNLGDLDGDGREELFLSDSLGGTSTVLYGRPITGSFDLADLTGQDGFMVYGSALANLNVTSVGDANGDGHPDLAATNWSAVDGERTIAIYNVPARGSGGSLIVGPDMDAESGYAFDRGGLDPANLGQSPTLGIGDLNNDGLADALASASATPVNGFQNLGAAYVLFGQNPKPTATLGVGPSLTPKLGVAVLGGGVGTVNLGWSTASLGDLDGDGLPDFAVSAPGGNANGIAAAGTVYTVYGKSLIDQVKTGKAAGIGNTSAVVNANLWTNDRDSEVWFEYGTSTDYGDSTDPESFEASNGVDSSLAAIEGLEKNTTYHYRAVAKNALGLVRYGDDQTFTTTNADDKPIETCDLDPSGPGCEKYCEANPTAMGCPDYDWCAANPGKCSSGGGQSDAGLALVSTTKKIAVKRGKKGTLAVAVVNTGGKAAGGVKVCVKAPKKLVKVKKCVKVGKLGSGKTRVAKVKVTAKRKKGKATLKLTASGNKLSAKKATAKVVVR